MLLALSLTSCAERVPDPPDPIVRLPPESVFKPCEQPQLAGSTWGDIGAYTLALKMALSICTGQVVTLKEWRETVGRR
ncbi:Rz1-like lysis system protein LysC [Serratia rubidaea]